MSKLIDVRNHLSRKLDRLILSGFSWRVSTTFEETYDQAPPFEAVLAATEVSLPLLPEIGLLEEREYRFWLHTELGRLPTRLRVLPAERPDAPLLVYHHGFFEIPYHLRAELFFRPHEPFDAHIVLLEAPYHRRMLQPLDEGFRTLHHLYQMIAGSVRMMQMVVDHYLAVGAPFAVASGMSLGGLISLMHAGIFGRTQAVIPILSSPNFAQLLWDIGRTTNRPVVLSIEQIESRLDFTYLYSGMDLNQVHPIMGINDRFFRHGSHARLFDQSHLKTIRSSHISGMWHRRETRDHILSVLDTCRAQLTRPPAPRPFLTKKEAATVLAAASSD